MTDVAPLVEALFRRTAGKLTAAVTRVLGPERLDLADDVVQDALLQALRHWPFSGVPDEPAAWLMRVARNRALDLLRRDRTGSDTADALAHHLAIVGADPGAEQPEDMLHLLFAAADPRVGVDGAVTVVLQALAGLSAREVAKALGLPEATVAQRLVRAKRRLREPGIGPAAPFAERLEIVLAALHAMLTEGHAPVAADLVWRDEVAREALRLALLLTRMREATPAVHALAALACFTVARFPARADDEGVLVLLPDQDRSRWDRRWVDRGFHYLQLAADGDRPSRYHFEAAIAAEHLRAPSTAATNWSGIIDLYDGLHALEPSDTVRVQQAVAVAMRDGAEAGLAALERVALTASDRSVWFHAVRAWLREQAGDGEGARADLAAALALDPAGPHRRLLQQRLG
jgi:RNA polymerase sigma factor (sigma-70 family)